ncbi:MAG: hypothetical protein Q4A33_00655 [Candidatus Saccharibacteria bacterium]|nr:hypothetical protein [Candidatus Saccharibacteria bacterium]
MADKAKKSSKKKLIAGIIAAILVIACIVVAVLLVLNRKPVLDDNFFKDDGTKYVLTQENGVHGAVKTHQVIYYNSEDKITKMEIYSEYADADTAELAFEYVKSDKLNEDQKYELRSKYIIHYVDNFDSDRTASSYRDWFRDNIEQAE